MQFDFHFSVTYVCARLAGFDHEPAYKIAYSSQYVDDATEAGEVHFTDGTKFVRTATAHKMVDSRMFNENANFKTWGLFHFLPSDANINRIKNMDNQPGALCRPNSVVAQNLLQSCLADAKQPYFLHRLGITAHVYADTWSHQGFSGTWSHLNVATDLQDQDPVTKSFFDKFKNAADDLEDQAISYLVQPSVGGEKVALGHAAVVSLPDLPFAKWSYRDYRGKEVKRDNQITFLEATDHLMTFFAKALQALNQSNQSKVLSKKDRKTIGNNFTKFVSEDETERNKQWLQSIQKGDFGFSQPSLGYPDKKSTDSWKAIALDLPGGADPDQWDKASIPRPADFNNSDWKLFHDAVARHRGALSKIAS